MKILRKLLLPFSLLYGAIVSLRNLFYDLGWIKSKTYALPIICVGNLSTGGTGKSPMIEFLIDFLKNNYRVAVLSRGYKRQSTGFSYVAVDSSTEEVGDEPLQFKKKFPKITVAVCANRQEGIEKLKGAADVILLDDAFQHRKVKASTYILLTTFNDLYTNDWVLPAGNLREPTSGAKRTDIVIVTKCPAKVSHSELKEIENSLHLKPDQNIFFSKIEYGENIVGISEQLPLESLKGKEFTLVTGIANPRPLVAFLIEKGMLFKHKKYADHHHFSSSEINELKSEKIILTTEKDFVRLQPKITKSAIYYLPIKTVILNGQDLVLKRYIEDEITKFNSKKE